jgi:hypothetical protein
MQSEPNLEPAIFQPENVRKVYTVEYICNHNLNRINVHLYIQLRNLNHINKSSICIYKGGVHQPKNTGQTQKPRLPAGL